MWSFTIPVACMCAYITVEPVNLKPRFFKSLLKASEITVVAGTSSSDFGLLSIGFPPTNPQIYFEKLPNSSCVFINACAFVTVAFIFNLFRIIPGFSSSVASYSSGYLAIF